MDWSRLCHTEITHPGLKGF